MIRIEQFSGGHKNLQHSELTNCRTALYVRPNREGVGSVMRSLARILCIASTFATTGCATTNMLTILNEAACGGGKDLQVPREYKPPGPTAVSRATVLKRQSAVVRIIWTDRASKYRDVARKFEVKPEDSYSTFYNEAHCTGTLIARDLIITAAHCIYGGGLGVDKIPLPEFTGNMPARGIAQLLRVEFFYDTVEDGKKIDPVLFDVERLEDVPKEIYYNYEYAIDFAILKIKPLSGTSREWETLRQRGVEPVPLAERPPEKNEQVAIIQHPNGSPKRVAAGNAVRGEGFAPDGIERRGMRSGAILQYAISTNHKSSGAAIIDRFGRVIGIHKGVGGQVGSLGDACDKTSRNYGPSIDWMRYFATSSVMKMRKAPIVANSAVSPR